MTHKEFESVAREFNNQAVGIFFSLYDKFRGSVSKLNRQKDENVFQQELAKYLFTLREQLEMQVKELIHKNRSVDNIDRFKMVSRDLINGYLNEFKQKSTSF